MCVCACVCENSKSQKSSACSSAGLGHGCVLIQRTVGCDHTVPTSLASCTHKKQFVVLD